MFRNRFKIFLSIGALVISPVFSLFMAVSSKVNNDFETNSQASSKVSDGFKVGEITTSSLESFGKITTMKFSFNLNDPLNISEIKVLNNKNETIPFYINPDLSTHINDIDLGEVNANLQDNKYISTNAEKLYSLPQMSANEKGTIAISFYRPQLINRVHINSSNTQISEFSIVDHENHTWTMTDPYIVQRVSDKLSNNKKILTSDRKIYISNIENLYSENPIKKNSDKLDNSYGWEGGGIVIGGGDREYSYATESKKFRVSYYDHLKNSENNLLIYQGKLFTNNSETNQIVNPGFDRNKMSINIFKPSLKSQLYSFYWVSKKIDINELYKADPLILQKLYDDKLLVAMSEQTLSPRDFGINNNANIADIEQFTFTNEDIVLGNKAEVNSNKKDVVIIDINKLLENYDSSVAENFNFKYKYQRTTANPVNPKSKITLWSDWININLKKLKSKNSNPLIGNTWNNLRIPNTELTASMEVKLSVSSKRNKWINFYGMLSFEKTYRPRATPRGEKEFTISSSDISFANSVNGTKDTGLSELGEVDRITLKWSYYQKYIAPGQINEIEIRDLNNNIVPFDVVSYYYTHYDNSGSNLKENIILSNKYLPLVSEILQDKESFFLNSYMKKYSDLKWKSEYYGGGYLNAAGVNVLSGSFYGRNDMRDTYITLKLRKPTKLRAIGYSHSYLDYSWNPDAYNKITSLRVTNTQNKIFRLVNGNLTSFKNQYDNNISKLSDRVKVEKIKKWINDGWIDNSDEKVFDPKVKKSVRKYLSYARSTSNTIGGRHQSYVKRSGANFELFKQTLKTKYSTSYYGYSSSSWTTFEGNDTATNYDDLQHLVI